MHLRIVFGLHLFIYILLTFKSGICDDYDNGYEDLLIEYSDIDDNVLDMCEQDPPDIIDLNATEIEATRMILKWDTSTSECPVLEFWITWNANVLWDPDKTTTGMDSSEDTEYIMSNMIPYSNYSICVQAVITDVLGNKTCICRETTEGKPGPPTHISSESLSSSSINIAWSAPPDANGILGLYLVKWDLPLEEDSRGNLTTNSESIGIDNLLACGNYFFSVQASTTGAGYGIPVTTQSTVLTEVPPMVTMFDDTGAESRTVTLIWNHPATLCPILEYSFKGTGKVLWEEERNATVTFTVPGNETSHTVEDLIPMTNYSFYLAAVTEKGTGDTSRHKISTLEDVPSKPLNLNTTVVSSSEVNLEWAPPKDRNGNILAYNVTWQQEGMDSQFVYTEKLEYNIEGLQACTNYTIEVSSSTAVGYGPPATNDVYLNPEIPPAPIIKNCVVQGSTLIKATWNASDTLCAVSEYKLKAIGKVIWKEEQTSSSASTTSLEYTLEDLVPYTDYEIAVTALTEAGEGHSDTCKVTTEEDVPGIPVSLEVKEDTIKTTSFTITWMAPNVINGKLQRFNVTWNRENQFVPVVEEPSHVYSLDVTNLDLKTSYDVTVTAETGAGIGEPAQTEASTKPDVDTNIGLLLGVLIPVIIILLLLGFGFIYRDNIKSKMKTRRETYPAQNYEEHDKVTPPSIPLHQFRTYVNNLQTGNILSIEYNSLTTMSSYRELTREADRPQNQVKNRYSNILPYDETRVSLRRGPSRYINANYINSFSQPRFFIGAQGPKENTVEDFWNLIWQENVDIIVMLTSCFENGKEKCSQYWPLGYGIDVGDFSIQNINEEATPVFVVRVLEVTNKNESIKRLIKQYHHTFWPDFGVPTREDNLLKLLFSVKKNMAANRDNNKMLVHCSAGVGRTGTFIGLWNIIEEIDSGKDTVSVYKEVLNMRKQRVKMVQSKEQYLYLYKCVLAYHENKSRWQVKIRNSFTDCLSPDQNADLPGAGTTVFDNPCYNPGFETNPEFKGNLI